MVVTESKGNIFSVYYLINNYPLLLVEATQNTEVCSPLK